MEDVLLLKMAETFKGDPKRVGHALKVYGFARMIAGGENLTESERNTLFCAAILHDIGIHEAERKHGSSAGNYQEMEGPAVAGGLMEGLSLKEEERERILFLIGNHHSYYKIDAPDFQVLAEADLLVNIYEEEMCKDAVKSIKNKIFKTKTGLKLMDELYL